MLLKIGRRRIKSEDITSLIIASNVVHVQTVDDFFSVNYSSEDEIRDAKNWLRLKKLDSNELLEAVDLLVMACEFFLNTKEQCNKCPLRIKTSNCVFTTIPINWKVNHR